MLFKYVTCKPDQLPVHVGHDHISCLLSAIFPWMLSNTWISVKVLCERTFKRLAQLELEFCLHQWTDFCSDMVSLWTAVQSLTSWQTPCSMMMRIVRSEDSRGRSLFAMAR